MTISMDYHIILHITTNGYSIKNSKGEEIFYIDRSGALLSNTAIDVFMQVIKSKLMALDANYY